MAFSDIAKTDLDEILRLNEGATETVRYKSFATGGASPLITISALVEEGEIGAFEGAGFVDEGGRRPRFFTVSKTDVPRVRPRKDEIITADGTVHGVKGIEFESEAEFRLFCRQ